MTDLEAARARLAAARRDLDDVQRARGRGLAGATDVQRAERRVAYALATLDALAGWRSADDLEELRYSPPDAA